MRKIIYGFVCPMIFLLMGLWVARSPAFAAGPIKIRAVSYKATGSFTIDTYVGLIDRINKRAKGELVIDYLGGTEVVPSKDQPEAVKNGVIDMTVQPGSRFAGLIPESLVLVATSLSPMKERENGLTGFMVERFKTVNMFYLGRNAQMEFYLALNKKVARPQELAGLKIRSSSTYNPFVKALHASPIKMHSGEIYLAMERGVVDGYIQPILGLDFRKLYEVSDYFIDHPFYEGSNPVVVLNLDTWNKLPQHLKDLMTNTIKEYEVEIFEVSKVQNEKAKQKAIKFGMKPIKFSPKDAKWFRDLAYDAYFEGMKKKVSPDSFSKLMKFLGRVPVS
jgi:TRAP-type C4-dicarboxylate transport system substrate-binding protein